MLKTTKYVVLLLNLYSNILSSTTCTKIVTVNEGEEASFECSAETTEIWWNRYELYSLEIIPTSTDSRFFLNNSTWPYFNLTISNIQLSDEGIYRCMFHNITIIAEYLLLVQNEPSNDKKIIKEYAPVELRCFENTEAQVDVIWVRENNETFPSGKYSHIGNGLKFNNVSRFHVGTYRCKENRGNNSVKIKDIDLAVKYAPIIRNLSVITESSKYCPIEEVNPEEYRIELAWAVFDIGFECLVEAYPEPDVSWYKDNTRLINNMNYRIERRKVNATVWKSTLRMIESNQDVNNGVYKVVARNKVATVSSKDIPFGVGNLDSAAGKTIISIFTLTGCILLRNYL